MKWYKSLALITALLLFTVTALCACSAQPPQEAGTATVRVVVTHNFGQELIFDKTVEVEAGICALDALKQVADVETAYGGGFINAINGVRSGYTREHHAQKDWFLYVNGILTNVGALNYSLHPDDIEHWDFHDWGFHTFIPAIIGDFPEPFGHGYKDVVYPTMIAYQDGWEGDAKHIASRLNQLGVDSVFTKSISELSEKEKEFYNLLLLGTMDCQPVSELNQVWRRLGFYAHFEDDNLVVLNSKGKTTAEYGAGAGLIQATQSPWNPKGIGACENVVWMVSGIDKDGVKNAIDVLTNHCDEFRYTYAVVIANGGIIKLPR